MLKPLIAPSILSADFARMGDEVMRMERAGADLIHCDVMDGVFVPNITFGLKMVEDVKKVTGLELDVHLMIVNPQNYVERFCDAGADYVTFHVEACDDCRAALQKIKNKGKKCGLVISPDTPVSALKGKLELCDMALLMSVYPGFGGQKFIPASLERLRQLRKLADAENPQMLLEIDGGVTTENIGQIVASGAQVIVAGNTVFSSPDPAATIRRLKGIQE